MTEAATPVTDKDIIDGCKVVHREMAKVYTPLSKYEDGLSPTYGVDKCVLDDGRVVHQCVHPDPPTCTYWHLEGVSVRSHLRVHTNAKKEQETAAIIAERDALRSKEAQRKQNHKLGALKAAAVRRANAAAAAANSNSNGTENGNGATVVTVKDQQQKIDNVQTSLEGAAEGLDRIGTVLDNIRKTVENAVGALEDLSNAGPVVDPVLADKAARWDALQGLIGSDTRKTR
jgi:hypothetical protein